MNEKNNIRRLRKLVSFAGKRLTELEKASKLLLNIGSSVFFVFLLAALSLTIMHFTGAIDIYGQIIYIEWLVLYSLRFWVVTVFGALILDVLLKR